MASSRTALVAAVVLLAIASCVAHEGHDHDEAPLTKKHRCGHERFMDRLDVSKLHEVESSIVTRSMRTSGKLKTLQFGAGFEGMRVNFNSDLLDSDSEACSSTSGTYTDLDGATQQCTTDDILSSTKKAFLRDTLVADSVNFFKSIAKVDPIADPLKWTSSLNTCAGFPVPQAWKDGVANSDFNVILAARPTGGTTLAYASFCRVKADGRPVFGIINFDPSKIDTGSTARAGQIGTMRHELMHAIVFSPSLYAQYKDKNGVAHSQTTVTSNAPDGHEITRMVTPAVKAAAQAHYGCSSLEGLEIENGGGSGSQGAHWEMRLVHSEFMAAQESHKDPVYSRLSLALFEDSGWFVPDYTKAETLLWGNNKGCDWATKDCGTSWSRTGDGAYFCTSSDAVACDVERSGYGPCTLAKYTSSLPTEFQYFSNDPTSGGRQFMDFCPIYTVYSNRQCKYSSPHSLASSRGESWASNTALCMMGTLSETGSRSTAGPGCYDVRCAGQTVQVSIGGTYANCENGVATRSGWSGSVTCPSSLEAGCTGSTVATPIATPTPTPTASTSAAPTSVPSVNPSGTSTPTATSNPTSNPTSTPVVTTPGICGNGQIDSGEGCDDGNTNAGDGCSSTCLVEQGWSCSAVPSKCTNVATSKLYWSFVLTKAKSEVVPSEFTVDVATILTVDQSVIGFVSLDDLSANKLLQNDLAVLSSAAERGNTQAKSFALLQGKGQSRITISIGSTNAKTPTDLSTELGTKLEAGTPLQAKYGVVGASSGTQATGIDRCSSIDCSPLTCIDGTCKGEFDDGSISNETYYLYVALGAAGVSLILILLFCLVRMSRNSTRKKQLKKKAAAAKAHDDAVRAKGRAELLRRKKLLAAQQAAAAGAVVAPEEETVTADDVTVSIDDVTDEEATEISSAGSGSSSSSSEEATEAGSSSSSDSSSSEGDASSNATSASGTSSDESSPSSSGDSSDASSSSSESS